MGHAIAIAIIDRQPSALSIVNTLEHRSIATTLQSLLLFQPIFIPGGDRQSSLWVAAGDLTSWRIRVKAIGGICLNFLAIAILWQFIPNNIGDIFTRDSSIDTFVSAFLSQTVLSSNLLIILNSWSDIAASITGVAEIFCCGNFGFLGQRNANDDPYQLLPKRVVNIFNEMGRETEIRGEQAGGGLVVMGANPEIARKGFSNAIVLEGNDEYFHFRNAAFYFKDRNAEDRKVLIEDLRESWCVNQF